MEQSIWYKRWQAMVAELDDMEASYQGSSSNPLPRQETLLSLVNNLRSFGTALFELYWWQLNRPANEKPIPYLAPLPDFPEAYIYNMFLDRVGQDIAVIQAAAAQRQEIAGVSIVERQQLLERSDRLAYKALQPALDKWCPGATALTYLGRLPRARVIPYADVALVGIPFTSRGVKQDYLATAHEVGHYIYWNAQFKKGEHPYLLTQEFPKWCADWREEIFADMYGAWVAGAPAALMLQEILLDDRPADFFKNSGQHPVPYIRPYIYTKLLHEKGVAEDLVWLTYLRNRWQQKRQALITDVPEFVWDDLRISYTEVINTSDGITQDSMMTQGLGATPVDKLMGIIAKLFRDDGIAPTSWAVSNQGDEVPAVINDEAIWKKFDLKHDSFTSVAITEANAVVPNYDQFDEHPLIIKLIERANGKNNEKERWEELVYPFAWVSRGPQEQPNPPKP
ncbi:MAG: hypothetical protein KJ063_04915 [Anaerolineae bacterium]|nr:hypothetical protein [Anaerolineae bacterium]